MFHTTRARLSFIWITVPAVLLALLLALPAAAMQAPDSVRIASPGGGEALQGVVLIQGASDVTGFRAAELSFTYQSNPTGSWFLIQHSSAPVREGELARWDTTTISDGDYRLRLVVYLADGRVLSSEVSGLRVRNYSPIETSTPGAAGAGGPAAQTRPVTPSATPADYQPAPRAAQPLPTNPAQLTGETLGQSALWGGAVVVALLALTGLYLGLRALARR